MKFTLHISTDSKCKDIKERCCEILAEFLKKDGYFSVKFDPNEIDTDKKANGVVDFFSVHSREEVAEIDKRIERDQKEYDAKLRDKMMKAKDFPMTN